MSAVAVRRRVAGLAVFVSDHARERARERFPGFKAARIVDEVHEALLDGRVGAEQPGWAGKGWRWFSEPGFFVWTPALDRAYVLRLDGRPEQSGLVVVTVLAREQPSPKEGGTP